MDTLWAGGKSCATIDPLPVYLTQSSFILHLSTWRLAGAYAEAGKMYLGRAPRAALSSAQRARSWRRVSSLSQHLLNAERLVGYPASLLGLKHVLGDELAVLASHLKRLIGSRHPVVKTARWGGGGAVRLFINSGVCSWFSINGCGLMWYWAVVENRRSTASLGVGQSAVGYM